MSAWHPPDEIAAASAMAVFVEWLRATGRLTQATPDSVHGWAGRDPAGFAADLAGFAGLDPTAGARANLLHHGGGGEALVLHREGARLAWTRERLRTGAADLPGDLAAGLDSLEFSELLDFAAWQLLGENTRPDQRLLWAGAPGDRRAFGVLIAGATLILADAQSDLAALAAAERASLFRPPPSARDAG